LIPTETRSKHQDGGAGEISQALEWIPFRWNKPSLRAERSNPEARNVPFVLDCFVGDASSQ
jgi:hypothetical protein